MIICKGEGELMIDVEDGEVVWTTEEIHYRVKGYKSVNALEGYLGLDPQYLDLPKCTECYHYNDCLGCLSDVNQSPDRMDCTAFDAKATSSAIMGALANLNEYDRKNVLSEIF